MKKHFLAVFSFLQPYAERVSSDSEWQTKIFEDLTNGGKEILFVPVPGGGIGLCGDVYYCLASADKHRDDTLFVYRVESAETSLPKTVPERYEAEFQLIRDASEAFRFPALDSTRTLVGAETSIEKIFLAEGENASLEDEPATGDPLGNRVEPCAELVRLFEGVAAGRLVSRWRIVRSLGAPNPLEILRGAWKEHSLGELMVLAPRWKKILAGEIRPAAEPTALVDSIVPEINVEMLNRFARRRAAEATKLESLLEDLARLSLGASVRAVVWRLLVANLRLEERRNEILFTLDHLDPQKSSYAFWIDEAHYALEELASEIDLPEAPGLSREGFSTERLRLVFDALDSAIEAIRQERAEQLESEDSSEPSATAEVENSDDSGADAGAAPAAPAEALPVARPDPLPEPQVVSAEAPVSEEIRENISVPVAARDDSRLVPPPSSRNAVGGGVGQLAPMQAAIFRLLNQPVTLTLSTGARIPEAVIVAMNEDTAFLEQGGMVGLGDIRTIVPLGSFDTDSTRAAMPTPAPAARQGTGGARDASPFPERPPFDPGVPTAAREQDPPHHDPPLATAASSQQEPQQKEVAKETPAHVATPDPQVPGPPAPTPVADEPTASEPSSTKEKEQDTFEAELEFLRGAASEFEASLSKGIRFSPELTPPATRFPKDHSLTEDRRRQALKLWSQSQSYLENHNLEGAKRRFIELSGLMPSSIEPVCGLVYSARKQSDLVTALAALQCSSHLLAKVPELARVEVALAVELGMLQTAARLLRRYATAPFDMSSDTFRFLCHHGLIRNLAILLDEEPAVAEGAGSSLFAYLLLRTYKERRNSISTSSLHRRDLTPSLVLPILLTSARNQPSAAYVQAERTEKNIQKELDEVKEQIRDTGLAAREEGFIGAFEATINASRRTGDYQGAMAQATRALAMAQSQKWKSTYRSIVNELRPKVPVSRPAPPRQRPSKSQPTKFSSPRSEVSLSRQAWEAAVQGRLDEAIEKYLAFLEKSIHEGWDDQADKALNGLAMVYDRLQERDKAIEVMLEYERYVKSRRSFSNQLATLFFLTSRFDESAKRFQQAAALSGSESEKNKALKNARLAKEQALTTSRSSSEDSIASEEFGQELVLEYLERPLHLNLQMREITHNLDPFLEPEVERLSKDGMEMFGIDRGRVAREEFDHKTIQRLVEQAHKQRHTQGVRSRMLASALYIFYQKGLHQDTRALERIKPSVLQTQLAGSLGDDAAAQDRNEVAREYYTCLLERSSHKDIAKFKVQDYIFTFTGERFDPSGKREVVRMDRFRDLLKDRNSEARIRAVWGVLCLSGVSVMAYNAVLEVIDSVREPFERTILDIFPEVDSRDDQLFESAVMAARLQQRRTEDQFYRFRRSAQAGMSLPALCDAFLQVEINLPHNTLDFGREGRLPRWRRGLVTYLQQYFSAKTATERELRFQQASSHLEQERKEIQSSPTRFAVLYFLPLLDLWSSALEAHYEEWEVTVAPELQPLCLQVLDHPDGLEVELLIRNSRHSRTAHEVTFSLIPRDKSWKARPLSGSNETSIGTLEGGREEPQSWLLVPDGENSALNIQVEVRFTHLDRHDQAVTSTELLDIPIRPVPYRLIDNPYDPGPPVREEEMLKGREELVSKLARQVSDPQRSPFFRVIGARRVGKSSILEAVLRRLRDDPAVLITDRLDVAASGRHSGTKSFIQLWATALCDAGRKRGLSIDDWEWDSAIPPTLSFLSWVESEICPRAHPIILLDEFQAIAEKLGQEALKDFLDFWKYLVERRILSGIVCGVDSMDDLIASRGFGNQFASIKTEKVGYLSKEAARELIEQPVLLPTDLPHDFEDLRGESRFTEGAVEAILDWTAASPFYLQLLCHNVVHTLNDGCNMLVTEMTIKKAVLALRDQLGFDTTFENLTAFRPEYQFTDSRDDAMIDREVEGRILYTIALATRDRPYCDVRAEIRRWPSSWQEHAQRVLTALVQKEVVISNESGFLHRIRVGLFRLWLQTNQVFGDTPAPTRELS